MKYFVVDAFTDELFKGNPAGVCILDKEISNNVMQKIAFENNLAETAFLREKEGEYYLRWFTPDVEIDLCGHATLATAFIVMNYMKKNMESVCFHTVSGILTVTRYDDMYTMDFPSRVAEPVETNRNLEQALGCKVLETRLSRDLLVLVESEKVVTDLKVDFDLLREINKDIAFAIVVTAEGENCDFVSRFFAPNAGVNEDPVTGSSHSTLIPFWSESLEREKMTAKQLSPRGGTLICELKGDRVNISGKAVCYLEGELKL